MAQLFRKQALDTMSTPEQLDKHVIIMRPSVWVLYTALVAGFVTFIIWSFTYKITNGVTMNGVVFTNNNVVTTSANRDCLITDVLVKEGDAVEIGYIIAVVSNTQQLEQINRTKAELKTTDPKSTDYKVLSEKLEELTGMYIASTVIKAEAEGYVQTVKSMGTSLAPGDVISTIMVTSGYNEVVAYVPMQMADNLSLGMAAQVSPGYAPREEYGYMTGAITSISTFAVSEDDIITKMGDLSYVEGILPEGSYAEVCIRLDINDKSRNNYNWSNPKGEKLAVELGTQCSIIVVTSEYLPFELLL